MDALIVGAGAVGRWVGSHLDGPVAFADTDPAAAEEAAAAVKRGSVGELDGSDRYDLVAVSVPMRVAEAVIETQAERARQAVVDFTGSMTGPLAAMERGASDREQVSYHPLFAPAHAPGRIATSAGNSGPVTDELTESFAESGNTIVPVEPAVHDEAMATVQGLSHAAILAFGLAAADVPEELATPVYEDLKALRERVTSGAPGVYADIQDTFDGIEALQAAVEDLAAADRTEFEALYEDAE